VLTIIDLTRRLTSRSLSYPGTHVALTTTRIDLGTPDARLTYLSHLDLHAGTHIDAPLHFVPGADGVLDLGIPVLPAVVIRTEEESIPASVLPATPLDGRAVLFHTGWSHDLESGAYYQRFPHISPELANALVARGAALVGLDTPSADSPDASPQYPVHRILLRAGIPIVEGLCNLDAVELIKTAWYFAVFPLAIDEVEGAPARAVALLPSAA
jgi:arylformamidase